MPESPERTEEKPNADDPKQEAPKQEAPKQEEPGGEEPAAKTAIPPYVGVGLLVAALVLVLLVVVVRSRKNPSGGDEKSITAVSAELEAMRSEVNRQRMSMGLRPLSSSEGGAESVDIIAKRLTKDAETIVGLASSFQDMLKEKDVAIDSKNSELINSERLRQSLAAENSRLQQEVSRLIVGGADGDLAKQQVNDLKGQRDRIAADYARVQKELADKSDSVSTEEVDTLRRQLDETRRAREFFEKRVAELEAELAKLKIFASSENELLPAAVELFRTLRGLEGKKDSDNMTAYSEIGAKLDARVMRTLDFPTGSSEIPEADQQALPGLVEGVEDGDLILVVGYASTTGNAEANQKLSSDRATAVAQSIAAAKRPGQMVQAVYIGQTDRFSSAAPERNQICEVWHIHKK